MFCSPSSVDRELIFVACPVSFSTLLSELDLGWSFSDNYITQKTKICVVITNVQNYIQFQLGNIIFRTYQAGNCLFKFEPADFAEGEGKTTSGDFVKSQKVSSIIFNQKVSIILIAQFLANILSKWSLIAPWY